MRALKVGLFIGLFWLGSALWGGAFEDSLAMAKAQNKPLVVMVSSRACPYCIRTHQQVLSQPLIQKALEGKIWLEVNRDEERLAEAIETRFVPSFFYFSPTGELLGERLGYQLPEAFLEFLLDP